MQHRDGSGSFVSALYTERGVTTHQHGPENDALVHSHPLGRGQHRHGEPMERYWRREEYQDGIHVRTLEAMR